MSRTAVAFGLGLLTGCSTGAMPPPDVAGPVREALAGMALNGRPAPSVGRLARPVVVSGKGNDWLIDYSRTGDMSWCGTGGCTRQLWVERSGGHVLAFDEQVREWRLSPGQPTRLDIEIHGSNCDLAGVSACRRGYLWDEAAGRLVETTNSAGEGYLVGPLFQVVGLDEAAAPEAVRAEVERRGQACREAGGAMDGTDHSAVSSPDLNGDRIRDWIVGSRFAGCWLDGAGAGVPDGVSVMISQGAGWRRALQVPETGYAVDVSHTPARFGVRLDADCLDGPRCPTRFYVWRDGGLTPE